MFNSNLITNNDTIMSPRFKINVQSVYNPTDYEIGTDELDSKTTLELRMAGDGTPINVKGLSYYYKKQDSTLCLRFIIRPRMNLQGGLKTS